MRNGILLCPVNSSFKVFYVVVSIATQLEAKSPIRRHVWSANNLQDKNIIFHSEPKERTECFLFSKVFSINHYKK